MLTDNQMSAVGDPVMNENKSPTQKYYNKHECNNSFWPGSVCMVECSGHLQEHLNIADRYAYVWEASKSCSQN